MSVRPQPSPEIVDRLHDICRRLPQTRREPAWVGTRWRVRQATFAHVVAIEGGWPRAYAQAAGTEGPATVLTFRSRIAALDPLNYAEAPFFRPVWFRDIVGLTIDEATDWDAVAMLIEGSYCALAPQKLAMLVEGPGP